MFSERKTVKRIQQRMCRGEEEEEELAYEGCGIVEGSVHDAKERPFGFFGSKDCNRFAVVDVKRPPVKVWFWAALGHGVQ